jgi:hypothetical protein
MMTNISLRIWNTRLPVKITPVTNKRGPKKAPEAKPAGSGLLCF